MSDRRPVRRLWMPVTVLVLAAAAVGALWGMTDLDRGKRVGTIVFMVVPITLLLLTTWLLFLSGLRWWLRLGLLAGVIAVVAGVVRKVEFQGDMVPIVHFRWEGLNDLTLEAHRARQAKAGPADTPIPSPRAEDFPEYRNRARDGIVTVAGLNTDWKAVSPRELWRQPCGGGYAGFAVVGPFAVTIEQRRDQEAVVCYDADTGRERWVYSYPAHFSESLGGDGPRATPTIADGDVYSLGADGKLVRLDGAIGRPKWEANILENNTNADWAMSGSPLVFDTNVVVSPGTQSAGAKGRAVIAYDRNSGVLRWSVGDRHAGYSSPMLATLAGERQILLLDGEALAGYDVSSGNELWVYSWPAYMHINVAQPLVLDGDRVFISTGYDVGCAMLKVSKADGKWTADTLWKNTNMRCKFTSPVYHDGHLYGMDEGILACIDARDGKRKWKGDRFGNGQLLLAGDVLIIGDEAGKLVIAQASPEKYRELGRVQEALPGRKNWNHLAVAGGRAFLRNHFEMTCYDLTAPVK